MSAGAVDGRFSSVSSSGAGAAGVTQNVTYTAATVDLAVAPVAEGATLGDMPQTGSPTAIVAPIDSSLFTAAGSAALLGGQAAGARLLDHEARRCANNGEDATAQCASADGTLWLATSGDRLSVNGNRGAAPGFSASQYQFTTGVDWRFGQQTAGVALSYLHDDLAEEGSGDSDRVDTLRVSLYGAHHAGPVLLSGMLSYGYDDVHTRRPFGAIGTAIGNSGGSEVAAGVQASVRLPIGSVALTPHMGGLYGYFHGNAFSENGAGGQNLQVGTDNAHSLQPYFGVALDKTFGDTVHPVKLQLSLDQTYELLQRSRTLNVSSGDGTPFSASGASLPRARLIAGVRLDGEVTKQLHVSVGFTGWFNTGAGSQRSVDASVRYSF
ncbi:MAG: autotransporter outer membrane beta-barrel domain-containing protein [Pararobbsia sp.]